ncbi:hypothetical protein HMPREF0986_05080 [Escherichia coli 4_1_47FAA]|nr:hypothetical protein HMPREF0986_05080 [Escherichia coli 4_1_47FAA]
MCIKLALLFFRHEMPPILRSMPLFLLSEKILILFYQLVNHYTSILFPHSPFSLTIFLWNKVLFKKQANHSVSLDKF